MLARYLESGAQKGAVSLSDVEKQWVEKESYEGTCFTIQVLINDPLLSSYFLNIFFHEIIIN